MSATGIIQNEQIKNLVTGMTEEEVRQSLGDPLSIASKNDLTTPSKAFKLLGSQIQLPDDDIDAIWTYKHARLQRRRLCLGFKSGRLVSIWKLSESQE